MAWTGLGGGRERCQTGRGGEPVGAWCIHPETPDTQPQLQPRRHRQGTLRAHLTPIVTGQRSKNQEVLVSVNIVAPLMCLWSGSQSVVPRPAASSLPGNFLEFHVLKLHSRPSESENLGMGLSVLTPAPSQGGILMQAQV